MCTLHSGNINGPSSCIGSSFSPHRDLKCFIFHEEGGDLRPMKPNWNKQISWEMTFRNQKSDVIYGLHFFNSHAMHYIQTKFVFKSWVIDRKFMYVYNLEQWVNASSLVQYPHCVLATVLRLSCSATLKVFRCLLFGSLQEIPCNSHKMSIEQDKSHSHLLHFWQSCSRQSSCYNVKPDFLLLLKPRRTKAKTVI